MQVFWILLFNLPYIFLFFATSPLVISYFSVFLTALLTVTLYFPLTINSFPTHPLHSIHISHVLSSYRTYEFARTIPLPRTTGLSPTSASLRQRLGLFGMALNAISPFKYTFEFQVSWKCIFWECIWIDRQRGAMTFVNLLFQYVDCVYTRVGKMYWRQTLAHRFQNLYAVTDDL